jgi:hypothetical protein
MKHWLESLNSYLPMTCGIMMRDVNGDLTIN